MLTTDHTTNHQVTCHTLVCLLVRTGVAVVVVSRVDTKIKEGQFRVLKLVFQGLFGTLKKIARFRDIVLNFGINKNNCPELSPKRGVGVSDLGTKS